MQYQNINQGSSFSYPNHNINPEKKIADKGKWCMDYARAAFYDFNFGSPSSVFSGNGGTYNEYRMYALGKQGITQYKSWLGIDSLNNNTWLSVDWKIRAIVSGYRDKVISKLMKEDYEIVATPVDMLAKSEADSFYAQVKAKLVVRELMLQANPELASHPLISIQSGEPLDVEELEMRVTLGEQFNRSKDAELAIDLGFYENNYRAWRKAVYEDLFDYGVAGKKDWLGDDNKAKFRRCNPENVIISYCKDATFSDMVHAGEVVEVSLIELATLKDDEGNLLFTEKELTEFASSITGNTFNNPVNLSSVNGFTKPYDKFKCKVLDIEFFTYNESSYRTAPDESGNIDFRKADYGRGKNSEKYTRKKIQYVYKCKWIVGTDKCYDYGMCYDQKRKSDIKQKAKTKLSYSFCAYNFYEMKAQSFMEKLIPYADEYQLTMLKIQNFKNRAVPSGWWIDLDALENAALNKGGKNMEAKELLQMFFETGVLVGRSKDAANNPQSPNWKPVIPIENTAASELAMFYQDIINIVNTIERMIGYNEITTGNPNSNTLVAGYDLANQSTNDSLYPLALAEEMLTTELAEDVLCRMKQGLKKGKVSGYAPYKGALSANTLRFIELESDLSLRDFGIELQKRSTQQEKAWLMQNVQEDIRQGFLDTSDAVLIIECHNVKQALMILSYKAKKAKEAAHNNQMQLVQQQTQGNQQIAEQSAQMEMQKLQMEYQFKLQLKQLEIEGDLQRAQIMAGSQERVADQTNYSKMMVADTTGRAKLESTALSAQADLEKTNLAGLHQQEKALISLEKKPSNSE